MLVADMLIIKITQPKELIRLYSYIQRYQISGHKQIFFHLFFAF